MPSPVRPFSTKIVPTKPQKNEIIVKYQIKFKFKNDIYYSMLMSILNQIRDTQRYSEISRQYDLKGSNCELHAINRVWD